MQQLNLRTFARNANTNPQPMAIGDKCACTILLT